MFSLGFRNLENKRINKSTKKIPKIIHHIWMGGKEIPEVNKKCAESIKKVNNEFEYKLWKDDDVDNMMKTEFPK